MYMCPPEEKRKFLEEIFKKARQNEQPIDIQRQWYKFLLRDTNGGKLYKYRSFDLEGYSLENLQENTLHCSKPNIFNDPFDCKIGVTTQSIFDAIFSPSINVAKEILAKYVMIINGEMQIDDCSLDEQIKINSLLSSETLNKFLQNNVCETVEETGVFLKNNSSVFGEIMDILLSNEISADIIPDNVTMWSKMMENQTLEGVKILSGDDANFEDYVRANGIMDDTDEIGFAMLLGNKIYPEFKGDIDRLYSLFDELDTKLLEQTKGLFLVGCLCTSFKNRLMWAHYADKHKGFCIEYDFSGTEKEILSNFPLPVVYSEKSPLVPWNDILEESIESIKEKIILGLLTKDKIWEYENEWRIFIKATADANFKMPKISCIYLGASIEKENRDKIIDIARIHKIPVKQMRVDRGAYDLHAEDIPINIKGDKE